MLPTAPCVKHVSQLSSTAKHVATHLEVFSAELLHFPRLAVVLDNPSKELLDDLGILHHEDLRERRATRFARWLPRHCLLDLPHHQCSQVLHLFLELFGIELLSISARRQGLLAGVQLFLKVYGVGN